MCIFMLEVFNLWNIHISISKHKCGHAIFIYVDTDDVDAVDE